MSRVILFSLFIFLCVGLFAAYFPSPAMRTSSAQVGNTFQNQPTTTAFPTATDTPQPTPSPTPTPSGAAPSQIDVTQLVRNNLDKVLVAILTVLGTLFVVYFQKIINRLNTALEWVWKRFRVERALDSRYRKNLAKELRSIQILQMAEAKNLETIYIPLRLGEWMPPAMKDSHSASNQKTLSIAEALNQFQRITIVGGPGSGKTTITSHAAAALADRTNKFLARGYFPIYVQLRRLKEFLESESYKDKSLRDLLTDILEHHGFPDPRKFLDRHISNGTCLVVLDGFDELADETGTLQLRLSQKVSDFVAMLQEDDRVVLTSRGAGYEPAWFGGFQVLEMTDLTLPQVMQFVNGWFAKDQERGKSLQKIIEENERLQLLVTTPLMLAIVCFVYQTKKPEEQFLPTRRVDLYERCVKALVIDWDKSRGVDRKPFFSPKQIDTVLSHIAYDALLSEKIDFFRKALLALIRTHLPEAERMRSEDEKFLEEVMEHTGLFREKAHDTIGFIHLTFYEYLAAQVIAAKVLRGAEKKDMRSEIGEVLKNLANTRWFEPISLAAGILKGRPELVNVLYEEYKTRPTTELQLLLAGCLRDADLDKTDTDPDLLSIQDTILTAVVGLAFATEQVIA
jgi:predicted NACHT family NTPase